MERMLPQMVPPSVLVISHFLILSRKSIGTALGSSCLKSGTGKTGICDLDDIRSMHLHLFTPQYSILSIYSLHFDIFKFPDWGVASLLK